LQPPKPKATPVLAFVKRQRLPRASAQQEQTQNTTTLPSPKRVSVKVSRQKTRVTEIKTPMKNGHPHQGEAA
jgi:hypothetical protein